MKLNKLNLNHNLIKDYNTTINTFCPMLSPIKQETRKTTILTFEKTKFLLNNNKFLQLNSFNSFALTDLKHKNSIMKNYEIKNFHIEYIEFTKIILIIFLSEYLSIFLTNFISSSKIKFNIKLVHSLNNNINILGKYLSKELIKNPRGFKNLFKQYTKND